MERFLDANANTTILACFAIAFVVLLVRLAGKVNGAPNCPKCKSKMVTRIASKGKHEGKPFWGCSQHHETGCSGLRKK